MLLAEILKDFPDSRYNRVVDSLGNIDFQGIKIAIENRKGSIRQGEGYDGEEFKTKMFYPYGFIINALGADGDDIDVFVGPNKKSNKVFIVRQQIDGKYDEDKVMFGFDNEFHARDAYLAHFDTHKYLGPITEMTVDDFKEFLKNHKGGRIG